MNAKIVSFLQNAIQRKGTSYARLSEMTGISERRIQRIFQYGAVIRARELIRLSEALEIKQDELMALLDSAA